VKGRVGAYLSNIWKLNAIRVFFWMHFFGPVLVPFFTQWGGLKLSQVFYLNAWFFFCNFLFEIPTGALADSLGRKTSLALGSLLGACAAFLYASYPSFFIFMAGDLVFALAFTFYSGADEALAYDSLKAEGKVSSSKKILARMESFKLGGIVFAALTGGFIAERWGLPAPLRVTGVAIFLSFFFVLLIKEPGDGKHKARKRTPYGVALREGLRFFMGHRVLWILTLEAAAVNALAYCVIWLYQPFLQQDGLPLKYFGGVMALSTIGEILVLHNMERVGKWFGSKKGMLTAGGVITGLSFLAMGLTHSLWLAIPAIIMAFTFGLSRLPLFSSYMNKYIPSNKRATVLSASSMVRTLAIAVTQPFVGLLSDWSLPGSCLILGACLMALSLLSRIEEEHLKTSPISLAVKGVLP
jgi:MFS family permease